MKEKFDFDRFKKVLAMDARNLMPRFGLAMLILSVLPVAVWLVCVSLGKLGPDNVAPEIRLGIILFVTALASIMAPSRLYKSCNIPKKGLYFAMLPASRLEKFLSMMLFCLIVAPLFVLAGAVFSDCLLRILPFGPYNQWLFEHGRWLTDDWDNFVNAISDPYHAAWLLRPGWIAILSLAAYLSNVAIFFFSNTLFKKHKVIKTFLSIWGISFAFQLVLTPLLVTNGSEWTSRFFAFFCNFDVLAFYWFSLIVTLLSSALFFVWSYVRIKKMSY